MSGTAGLGDTRLDHIGIVVGTFDGLETVFREVLGLEVTGPEHVPEKDMHILWVRFGDIQLQFIRPDRDDTGAAAVLRTRGPGLHHLGVEVHDIAGALAALRDRGIALADAEPRPGARGSQVAFIAAEAIAGTELELIELAR